MQLEMTVQNWKEFTQEMLQMWARAHRDALMRSFAVDIAEDIAGLWNDKEIGHFLTQFAERKH